MSVAPSMKASDSQAPACSKAYGSPTTPAPSTMFTVRTTEVWTDKGGGLAGGPWEVGGGLAGGWRRGRAARQEAEAALVDVRACAVRRARSGDKLGANPGGDRRIKTMRTRGGGRRAARWRRAARRGGCAALLRCVAGGCLRRHRRFLCSPQAAGTPPSATSRGPARSGRPASPHRCVTSRRSAMDPAPTAPWR